MRFEADLRPSSEPTDLKRIEARLELARIHRKLDTSSYALLELLAAADETNRSSRGGSAFTETRSGGG